MSRNHFVNKYDDVLMGLPYQRPHKTYTIDPSGEISDEEIKGNEFLEWWFYVAPHLKQGDVVRVIETDREGRHFETEGEKRGKLEVPHNLIAKLHVVHEPPLKKRYYVYGLDGKPYRFGMLDRVCERVTDKGLKFQLLMGGPFVDE